MALPTVSCSGGRYKVVVLLGAAHTAAHTGTGMRSAVVLLSMVAAIAAEAPYHLPRPAAHAPSFSYPTAPAPPPPPPPHPHPRPHPQFIHYPPQPAIAPQYIQGPGYHYQQPSIAPTFVQSAPQPHPHFQSHPPAPQPIPVIPQPQYAQPHPLIPYPQQQYAQPQPIAQSQPQPIPQPQPSLSYGQPQQHIAPAPIQPLPAYFAPQPQQQPQPQPQPQAQPQPAPVSYYQPQVASPQGYSYQQPQPQPIQYTAQLPLQAQPLSNNAASSALSSYQADSNQYSAASAQSHGEALDSTVVDRVQSIIRDNEHTSARQAGYLSLVSGVSLEGARPSIEISSFVQNSPLAATSQSSEQSSIEQSSSSQSSTATAAALAPSQDYGYPTITANSQATPPDSSIAFLPQNKPATSYGAPQ